MWSGTLFFELSTLYLAYMSDCIHDRTSKMWWDAIVFKPNIRTYVKLSRVLRQRIMYWGICQDSGTHCYHNSERGRSRCILKQVDGLTLH